MTDTDGRQILVGLADTRKFFQQVSLLIRTVEDSLRDQGWDTLFGNKCAYITSHLYQPENWMPVKVYRFFVVGEDSESNKDKVIFVGVLLDGASAWGGFQEPWVTCGLYQFDAEKDVRKFDNWGWVSAHLDEEYDPDGAFRDNSYTSEEQEENGWGGLIYQSTMALPLVAIDTAQALKLKLIEPLLRKVEAAQG